MFCLLRFMFFVCHNVCPTVRVSVRYNIVQFFIFLSQVSLRSVLSHVTHSLLLRTHGAYNNSSCYPKDNIT